jgi:hypothetical protein
MSYRGGLLGALFERLELQQQLGCSPVEAEEIQQQLETERLREYEMATAESNVIPFRRKH